MKRLFGSWSEWCACLHASHSESDWEKSIRVAIELFERCEQPVEVAVTYGVLARCWTPVANRRPRAQGSGQASGRSGPGCRLTASPLLRTAWRWYAAGSGVRQRVARKVARPARSRPANRTDTGREAQPIASLTSR